MELIKIGTVSNAFETQVGTFLCGAARHGFKGFLFQGARLGDSGLELDYLWVGNHGIVIIECKGWHGKITGSAHAFSYEGGAEQKVIQQVQKQVTAAKERIGKSIGNSRIFVHSVVVFPEDADLSGIAEGDGIKVTDHPRGRYTGIRVCRLDELVDVLSKLDDATNRIFGLAVKNALFGIQLSKLDSESTFSGLPLWGKKNEVEWEERMDTGWLNPSASQTPDPDLTPEIDSEGIPLLQTEIPQPFRFGKEIETVKKFDLKQFFSQPKVWIGVGGAFVCAAGIWTIFLPTVAATPQDPVKPRIAQQTMELLEALDKNSPFPKQVLTSELRDALEQEYALSLRSLWPQGTLQQVTRADVDDGKERRRADFSMSTTQGKNWSVVAYWNKEKAAWKLDSWQVYENNQQILPTNKLNCRRDNRLQTKPTVDFARLSQLPSFVKQDANSKASFENFLLALNQNRQGIAGYFMQSNPNPDLNNIYTNPTTKMVFGKRVWKDSPVYWFTLVDQGRPPTRGVVSFTVEQGQVVIVELRTLCP